MDKVTAWTRGQLAFDEASLAEAVTELNRYSELKIRLASPELARLPVAGIFRTGDSASFSRAVADTYNLRVTRGEGEIVLSPR